MRGAQPTVIYTAVLGWKRNLSLAHSRTEPAPDPALEARHHSGTFAKMNAFVLGNDRFTLGAAIAAVMCCVPAGAVAQTSSLNGMATGWTQPGPVATAESCDAQRVPLMILGTYHMGNPGLDAVNVDADDVRSPQRQQEIDRLIQNLLRFKPTKIAVEWPYKDQNALTSRFNSYVGGTAQLSRNEVDQLGLRLARAAGLKNVEAVDFPMFMNGLTPTEFVNEPPRPAPSSVQNAVATPKASPPSRTLSAEEQLLRRLTVASYLRHINADTAVRANASVYPGMLLPDTSSPALYTRADLVTNWYKRNLRIFSNLTRATAFPNDRVVLIIGSGHIHILSDLALTSRFYCLVSPLAYLSEIP